MRALNWPDSTKLVFVRSVIFIDLRLPVQFAEEVMPIENLVTRPQS